MMEFKTITFEELVDKACYALFLSFYDVERQLKEDGDNKELLAARDLIASQMEELYDYKKLIEEMEYASQELNR